MALQPIHVVAFSFGLAALALSSCAISSPFPDGTKTSTRHAPLGGGGGGPCGSVTYEGDCQGTTVEWCEGGSLQQIDCQPLSMQCGLDPASQLYDCLPGGGTGGAGGDGGAGVMAERAATGAEAQAATAARVVMEAAAQAGVETAAASPMRGNAKETRSPIAIWECSSRSTGAAGARLRRRRGVRRLPLKRGVVEVGYSSSNRFSSRP